MRAAILIVALSSLVCAAMLWGIYAAAQIGASLTAITPH